MKRRIAIVAAVLAAGFATRLAVAQLPLPGLLAPASALAATPVTDADVAAMGKVVAELTAKGTLPAVATINGKDMDGTAYGDMLMQAAGRQIFDQVVELTLVQQSALDKKLPMDGPAHAARMEAELKRVMDGMRGPGAAPLAAPDVQRVLAETIKQRGQSPMEFRMWLETNAFITELSGKPASNGLDRAPAAREWLDALKKNAVVEIGDPALAALYPAQGAAVPAPAKFTVQRLADAAARGKFATVNGKDVNREAIGAVLRQTYGLRLFQQVMDLMLVQQAVAAAGLPGDARAVDERVQKELEKMQAASRAMLPAGATAAEWLGMVLARQHLSLVEFRIGLETTAGLRALGAGKAEATDEDVGKAYDAQYGERRQVHLLRLPADEKQAAEMAAKFKALLQAQKSPEEAAAELQQPAPANWMLSRNAQGGFGVDRIVAVAFGELKQPGDLSSVEVIRGERGAADQRLMVLLDKIEEDQTAKNPLTDALRGELRTKIVDYKQQQWIADQLQALRAKAAVEFKDPVLKNEFDQAAAAMQPAPPR